MILPARATPGPSPRPGFGYHADYPAPRPAPRQRGLTGAEYALLTYDVGLALLVLIAGSDGIYRFVPPTPIWVLIYGLVFLRILIAFREVAPAIVRNAAFLAYPAVCAVSTIWSVAPVPTAYASVQMAVSVLAAIVIGWRFRPIHIAGLVAVSFSFLLALSLLNWLTGAFGEVYAASGGLLGIFSQKNTLGRVAMVTIISCIAVATAARSDRIATTVALLLLAPALFALALSRSATSLLICFAALGFVLLLTIRRAPAWLSVSALAALAAAVLAVAAGPAALAFWQIDAAGLMLDAVGKTRTLTGRTLLWDFAWMEIAARPLLGVGFQAYWDSGLFYPVVVIEGMFDERLNSFHSFVLDIWVTTGIPGLLAIATALWVAAARGVTFLARGGGMAAAWPLALTAALVGVAALNPILYRQHETSLILVVALAVSVGEELRQGAAAPGAARLG